ncbi:MAG: MBL fold metallo-hydrolase [Acidobacteriota bacterium]
MNQNGPTFFKIIVGELEVNCYIIYSEQTKNCFIIDPGDNGEKILKGISEAGLNPQKILLTHGHIDHCGGISYIVSETGIPVFVHKEDSLLMNSRRNMELGAAFGLDTPPEPDGYFKDREIIKLDDVDIEVFHTPGHTPGSVCFKTNGMIFTGDTLFHGSIGRTDLPGGNFSQLEESLELLKKFPGNTKIHPGHGESSDIKQELRINPFL